jgi:hypothetical protein
MLNDVTFDQIDCKQTRLHDLLDNVVTPLLAELIEASSHQGVQVTCRLPGRAIANTLRFKHNNGTARPHQSGSGRDAGDAAADDDDIDTQIGIECRK